jgi:hypothetical protein
VWRSPSFVSKASVPFLMDTGQPPHAQTEAWPGWAFVRELISPVTNPVSATTAPFTTTILNITGNAEADNLVQV